MTRATENPLAEKFTRLLIASSCLVTASSAAAQTVVEGSGGAPADFGNNQGTAYQLPTGTTSVIGLTDAENATDPQDWFQFHGLNPGDSFQIHGYYSPGGQESATSLTLYNSSGTQLAGGTLEGAGAFLSGTVPNDGEIFAQILQVAQTTESYQVDLTTSAPEPGAWALMGGGTFAAGALLRRKRRSIGAARTQTS